MDNLTHSLIGLAVSKSGLEKISPGATALCVVAANAPDIDVVSIFFGDRWTALHYHRGITHSILGTAALAVSLPFLFLIGEAALARLREVPRKFRLTGLMV